jgi:hypothetical protein
MATEIVKGEGSSLQEKGLKEALVQRDICCKRNKYWSEMTDSEKINKLQQELSRTQNRLADVCKYVSQLIDHNHFNNHITIRLQNPNEESYNGLYFRPEDFNK